MLTVAKLNKLFSEKTPNIVLFNGRGYFYFIHHNEGRHESRIVRVAKVNDLTLDQWQQKFDEFVDDIKEVGGL